MSIDSVANRAHDVATRRRRAGRAERIGVGLALFALPAGALVMGLSTARSTTIELLGLIAVGMCGVGKFLPLWGISGQCSFGPWELGFMSWAIETASGVGAVYLYDWCGRSGRCRRIFDRLRRRAHVLLTAYPRLERGAAIGVAVFVLVPVTGTGGIVGAFLGAVLGLGRHTVMLAVSAGGFVCAVLMASLATWCSGALVALQRAQQQSMVSYVSVAVVILAALLALRSLTRLHRRALEAAHAKTSP